MTSQFPTNNTTVSGSEGTNQLAKFPDPFLDIATFAIPASMQNVFNMCTMLWLKNGTYSTAIKKIGRYFITDIDMHAVSEDERKSLTDYLNYEFDVVSVAGSIADDYLVYGASHSSVIPPFKRFLRCKKCKTEHFIDALHWDYSNGKFTGTCPKCRHVGGMKVVDRKSFDKTGVHCHRWNPYEIRIRQHPYTHAREVYWDINADYRTKVKQGDKFIIRDTPLEMLDTIHKNAIFKFHPDFIHSVSQESIAGINTAGYGIPQLISIFGEAYYNQVLKRGALALAQDYTVPVRVLSPAIPPAMQRVQGNPFVNIDMRTLGANISQMLETHRQEYSTWHFSPVPLQYQAMSGEGTMLAPELLDQGINTMLSNMGISPELFSGSIGVQAAPMALRMLQQSWPGISNVLSKWLRFTVERIARHYGWHVPENVRFKPVVLADDLERKQLLLQLSASNIVSKRTALASMGIDPKEENDIILEEQREEIKAQQDFQKQQEEIARVQGILAGEGMSAGAPGDPANAAGGMGGAAPGSPISVASNDPSGMVQQAQQTAEQLVRIPDDYSRKRALRDLKQSNPTFHALVKQYMEEIRNDARGQASSLLASGQM